MDSTKQFESISSTKKLSSIQKTTKEIQTYSNCCQQKSTDTVKLSLSIIGENVNAVTEHVF